jgi:hypothetical protein
VSKAERKMKFYAKYLYAGMVLFNTLVQPPLAHAQDESFADSPDAIEADTNPEPQKTTQSGTKKIYSSARPKSELEELGVSLIFAADLGLLSAFPAQKLQNYGPKFGLALEGKALGSILLDKFIIDAGLGWWFYSLTGPEPVTIDLGFGETTITDDVELKLSGTLLEVSPSYRIKSDVFAGPVIQLRYPADLGYDSLTARKKLGLVLGAQGGYQIFDTDLNTRFVGRVMMPLNDIDWLGTYLMVGVQVGLPFVQPEVLTVKEITTKTEEKRVVQYQKQEFKFKLTRDLVKVILDGLVIFYPDPGYPTLTTESQAFLIDFAKSLSESENQWGVMKIDTIGKDYANVVRDSLVSAGLAEKKVKVGKILQGKRGSTPPIELSFLNVKDQEKLQAAVRSAMQAMQVPETCDAGDCK